MRAQNNEAKASQFGLKQKEPKFSGSIAEANRWTGKPHDHGRERARNGWFRCRKGLGPFTLGGKTPRTKKAD